MESSASRLNKNSSDSPTKHDVVILKISKLVMKRQQKRLHQQTRELDNLRVENNELLRATINRQRDEVELDEQSFLTEYAVVGEFVCQKCTTKWKSYNVKVGVPEKCKKCQIDVRPAKVTLTHISAIERDLDSPLREANSIDSDDSIIEILTRELQSSADKISKSLRSSIESLCDTHTTNESTNEPTNEPPTNTKSQEVKQSIDGLNNDGFLQPVYKTKFNKYYTKHGGPVSVVSNSSTSPTPSSSKSLMSSYETFETKKESDFVKPRSQNYYIRSLLETHPSYSEVQPPETNESNRKRPAYQAAICSGNNCPNCPTNHK